MRAVERRLKFWPRRRRGHQRCTPAAKLRNRGTGLPLLLHLLPDATTLRRRQEGAATRRVGRAWQAARRAPAARAAVRAAIFFVEKGEEKRREECLPLPVSLLLRRWAPSEKKTCSHGAAAHQAQDRQEAHQALHPAPVGHADACGVSFAWVWAVGWRGGGAWEVVQEKNGGGGPAAGAACFPPGWRALAGSSHLSSP